METDSLPEIQIMGASKDMKQDLLKQKSNYWPSRMNVLRLCVLPYYLDLMYTTFGRFDVYLEKLQ